MACRPTLFPRSRRDAAAFEACRTVAAKAIAQYGGRYPVRGGAASVVEGTPQQANRTAEPFSRGT
ncbi:MAG: DUF1330 domain-containing protein [Bradyrhizobium sp.]